MLRFSLLLYVCYLVGEEPGMELGLWIVCWKRKVEMKGFAECVIHDRVLCTKD